MHTYIQIDKLSGKLKIDTLLFFRNTFRSIPSMIYFQCLLVPIPQVCNTPGKSGQQL